MASASAEKMGNPNNNSGDQRAEHNAKHCGACGLNKPAKETTARSERVFDGRHDVVEEADAHLREVFDDQVAAHPQHRNRSNNADCVENLGHHAHNPAADIIRGTGAIIVRMRRALG